MVHCANYAQLCALSLTVAYIVCCTRYYNVGNPLYRALWYRQLLFDS